MKKSSIIGVLFVFLVSFLVVGWLGNDVFLNKEAVYAEAIIWDYEALLNSNKDFKVETYQPEDNKTYNAKFSYRPTEFPKAGLSINIRCYVTPADADDTKLDYAMSDKPTQYIFTPLSDGTCNITFKKQTYAKLTVTTHDTTDIDYVIVFDIREKKPEGGQEKELIKYYLDDQKYYF